MFGLGKRDGDGGETAPVTLAGDYNVSATFEDGALVLAGDGFRLKLDKTSALILSNKVAMASRFAEIESPAHGPFGNDELKKTCAILRYLRHGLSLEDVAKIYGEKASSIRAFYAFGLDQALFRGSSAADDEKARLWELDRVRSTRGFEGGVMNVGGRLVSAVSGVPIPEQFARLNAVEVSKALRAAGGDVKDAAKALHVDRDDLAAWLEREAAMLAVIR